MSPPARAGLRFWPLLAASLCAVATFIHLWVQLPTVVPAGTRGRDVEVYYAAAKAARARQSPYPDVGPRPLSRILVGYLYPPPLAAAIAPLGQLSPTRFFRIWFAGMEICLWAFCIALAWLAAPLRRWSAPEGILLVGPLAFSPLLIVSFLFGQVDVVVFAACAGALIAGDRGRPWLAGALVAVAGCLKVYPLLLLLPLRRLGWKALASACLVVLALNGGAALWFGPGVYRTFILEVLPALTRGNLHEANVGPAALLVRLCVAAGWVDPLLPPPPWMRPMIGAVSLAVLAAICVVSTRLDFKRGFAWTCGLSTLGSAFSWTSYWCMFLIPLALFWRDRTAEGECRERLPFPIVAGLGLLACRVLDPLTFEGPLTVALLFGLSAVYLKDQRGARKSEAG